MKDNDEEIEYSKRQQHIIDATLKLISEQGLQGATIGKIAEEVGISQPALYRHFANRREIILAALETVTKRISNFFTSPIAPNAFERLHYAALSHGKTIIMNEASFIDPLFAFFAASSNENLRGPLEESFRGILNAIEECLKDGIREGSIRDDVDIERVVWHIVALGIVSDVAFVTGNERFFTSGKDKEILKEILGNISNKK